MHSTSPRSPGSSEIAEHTHESASLGVLDGVDVVYAARVPVRRIMSINVSVGTRVPAYATSMGRALLAWAPDEIVDQVIATTRFDKLTPATLGTPTNCAQSWPGSATRATR